MLPPEAPAFVPGSLPPQVPDAGAQAPAPEPAALQQQQKEAEAELQDPNKWVGRQVNCPHCATQLEIEHSDRPEKLDCPSCNREFVAPPSRKPKYDAVKSYGDLYVRIIKILQATTGGKPDEPGLPVTPHVSTIYQQEFSTTLTDDAVLAKFRNLGEALQMCPEIELLNGNAIRLKEGASLERYLTAAELQALKEREKRKKENQPRKEIFIPLDQWTGPREGLYFGMAANGLGYHSDPRKCPEGGGSKPKPQVKTLKIVLRRESTDDDWGFEVLPGMVVGEVEPDTPADVFGLMPGWRIVMCNDEVLRKPEMVKSSVGDGMKMTLLLMEPRKRKAAGGESTAKRLR
eukprot:TRINITY_DN30486_c0_g1_i1.p1 TRINITY_DN30486_c0_g1~~TRINITY_DN30486_c0_g1_i1.p1  ORF type:complete len:380 (+),score=140.39 TRINITY_DN30486_c0_g1_i1:104-1141(+)